MNIFITGSNGFVGSHLKEYLQKIMRITLFFTPSSKELDLVDDMSMNVSKRIVIMIN